MKKFLGIVFIAVLALIVSGFAEENLHKEHIAKIDRLVIRPALYGEDYIDTSEISTAKKFTWRHSPKLHAEKISEGYFKVYIPKAMYKVRQRLAELEK